jgi:hypothetical protein
VAQEPRWYFTSLPAPPDVAAVASGGDGILAGMKPAGVFEHAGDATAAHAKTLDFSV